MPMNERMREIESAIRNLCTQERPFVTVSDIAEHVSVSERTVLNHADGVVYRRKDIEKETVGKANVYYLKIDFFDEIETENTAGISRLHFIKEPAEYVELRESLDNSEFDLEAFWYDANGEIIEDYLPNAEEIGEAAHLFATEAVAIKFYDPEDALEMDEEDSE